MSTTSLSDFLFRMNKEFGTPIYSPLLNIDLSKEVPIPIYNNILQTNKISPTLISPPPLLLPPPLLSPILIPPSPLLLPQSFLLNNMSFQLSNIIIKNANAINWLLTLLLENKKEGITGLKLYNFVCFNSNGIDCPRGNTCYNIFHNIIACRNRYRENICSYECINIHIDDSLELYQLIQYNGNFATINLCLPCY